MSEIEKILHNMKGDFNEAMRYTPAIIEHEFVGEYCEFDGVALEVLIKTKYPDHVTRQEHKILLVCHDMEWPDQYGIDYKSGYGDIGEISPQNIMTQLYFDLALKEIEGEYLN